MTVTITGVNGPPTNGFPLAVSSGGQLFDLSSATGPDVSGIIPGAVYDMYVTGEYHPTYNTAETLYTVAWVSLISLPAYPYYGYGYPGNYQGWYQPGQPGTVYSNTVYVNNGQFFLFESDGFYHVVSPDVIQGYQITPGMPPANMIRW